MINDYNTLKNKLILPEYGRNIQKLVEHALTIEDKEKRNIAAQEIINILGNMNPHLRDINDFKHKLWDHLALMSNFQLEIDSPYPTPLKETFDEKPKKVEINHNEIKFKHFGRIIEKLIKQAAEIEDETKKNALVEVITNHMKKSYLMWNKEIVSDDVIFESLRELSSGKLQPKDGFVLPNSKDIMLRTKKRKRIKTPHTPTHTNR
jgi:CRISPR/Cas system-associated endonuclease Cas1